MTFYILFSILRGPACMSRESNCPPLEMVRNRTFDAPRVAPLAITGPLSRSAAGSHARHQRSVLPRWAIEHRSWCRQILGWVLQGAGDSLTAVSAHLNVQLTTVAVSVSLRCRTRLSRQCGNEFPCVPRWRGCRYCIRYRYVARLSYCYCNFFKFFFFGCSGLHPP